jgi:RimJ/RimL family protein N-acetyltransferase
MEGHRETGAKPVLRMENVTEIPESLRTAYLTSILESQELYVEYRSQHGQKFILHEEQRRIGYAVVDEGTIVEFFLVDEAIPKLPLVFEFLLTETKATGALCQTFDPVMLTAASSKPARTQTHGNLFRKIVDRSFTPDPNITVRLGTGEDIPTILTMHDDFFDNNEEITTYIRLDGLFLYHNTEGALIGCGISRQIVPSLNYYDIGMVVNPEHRGQRLGAYIIAHLKHHCLELGYRPVCGCDAENIASRRSLERAGFATVHSLVKFNY